MINKSLLVVLGCLFVVTFVAAASHTLTEDAQPNSLIIKDELVNTDESETDFLPLPKVDTEDETEKLSDVKDSEMIEKVSDHSFPKREPMIHMVLYPRPYPYHKNWKECLLGMKSGLIHDSQISADSQWNWKWSPQRARLDHNVYGWCPNTHKAVKHHWIQVDLLRGKRVTGVVLQGNRQVDTYRVLTYKVLYGNTEQNLHYVENRYGAAAEFIGCKDFSTPSPQHFNHPVWARFIRIEPTTWKKYPVMHFDLLKC